MQLHCFGIINKTYIISISGSVIVMLHRPLPENTQHPQETDIRAPGRILTLNLSK
jgi:hypothetical protein